MRKITALMPNPSAVNVYNLCAAIGEGYMAEEGLDINFEAVDGSSAVYQAMAAGKAEIGLPGPGPTIAAWGRGEKPVLFYNHFAQSLFGLVVPEKSGIKDVTELKGKVIGVGTAEGSEVAYARAILSDAGMKEKTDYTFLPVGDGGMAVAAIERGDIAAYSAAIPDMAIMTARGLALTEITPAKFLAYFGNGYATMTDTLQKDPELIAGFTRALLKGTWFAEQNKAKTLEHCAKLNPEEGADTELSSALFDAVLPRTHPLGAVALGEFTQAGWDAWQASLIGAGDLTGPVPYLNDMWTNTVVQQAHKDLGK
jgi:NitT/TauT family transport system substrate-binding protein